MTISASSTLPMVMGLEITGPKTRSLISVLFLGSYTIGCVLLWAAAYMIRGWRTLCLVTSIPPAVLFSVLWFFFPESPRWLLNSGKYDEVEKQLLRIARFNNVPVSEEFRKRLPEILRKVDHVHHDTKYTAKDLLRYPNLLKKTAILSFMNLCNKGVFMGLNYYAPSFGSDPHWSFLLANLIEFPPYLFAKFLCDRIGRRTSVFLGMCSASFCCLLVGIFDGNSLIAVTVLSLLGKFCITITYLISELMEGEIFPTVVRPLGNSLTSTISSIGGCLTPLVVHLGHQYISLPLLIYGSFCFVAAGAALFLPETANTDLPETLEDGENFGKDRTWRDVFSLRLARQEKKGADFDEVEKLRTDREVVDSVSHAACIPLP